jgi:hypothetical protein
MRSFPLFLCFLFLLGAYIGSNLSAFAENSAPITAEPVIPKPLKVMPTKIKPVQSNADELTKAAPDSVNADQETTNADLDSLVARDKLVFSNDFWNDSHRDDLVAFLNQPSTVSAGRTAHTLALRATITPATQMDESDDASQNIYALRIQRLVNLGDFKDAVVLYKMNNGLPPTPLAARAGVQAMLGSGKIAVACLEEKALDDRFKSEDAPFWANVDMFCQALLSPVAGDDDTLRLANASRIFLQSNAIQPLKTAAAFNQLDTVSAIALTVSGHASFLYKDASALHQLDDKALAILLNFAKQDQVSGYYVYAESIHRGILEDEDVLDILTKADIDYTLKSNSYAAFFKEYMKALQDNAISDSLLSLSNTPDKEAFLIPLMAMHATVPPTMNPILHVRLLAESGQEIPAALVKAAYALKESPENNGQAGESLLITTLGAAKNSSQMRKDGKEFALLSALNPFFSNDGEKSTAYENILSLTSSANYVMPTDDILSSLKKSTDEKLTSQTIVRGLDILSDARLDNLNPAAVYLVLKAFDSAGLNEEVQSLSREALGAFMRKS